MAKKLAHSIANLVNSFCVSILHGVLHGVIVYYVSQIQPVCIATVQRILFHPPQFPHHPPFPPATPLGGSKDQILMVPSSEPEAYAS